MNRNGVRQKSERCPTEIGISVRQPPEYAPGLSIKQVAEQMSFSSEFYFSHFFKKLKGVSPRNYREQEASKR